MKTAATLFGWTVLVVCPAYPADAQQTAPSAAELEQRLQAVTALLDQTRQTLAGSLNQLDRLQHEVDQLRAASAAAACTAPAASPTPAIAAQSAQSAAPAPATPTQPAQPIVPAPVSVYDRLDALAEEQEILRSQVQQHEQTKLESASKYPVRINGLLLFNAFSNSGTVDQIDLPSIALPRTAGQTYGPAATAGASLRQTILGLEASGPRLWGARSAASLNIDFFGDIVNSLYSAPSTTVRLRLAQFGLFWTPPRGHASVEVGIDGPLVSPLSPTSYATVAIPSLAWAGNLWTWSPQLRARYSRSLGDDETTGPRGGFEAGLLDPQITGLSGTAVERVASPGEQSRQPGVEGRAFFESGPAERPLAFGVGAYRSRQRYLTNGYPVSTTSWAATTDWRLPLGHRLSLSGEAYRGSGLGSLGGGAYKDALTGTDPRTGYARTEELDAAGGWSQLKLTLSEVLQANAAWGLDDAFTDNFHRLTLAPSTNPLSFATRGSMSVGNIIYRPKSYLILSPEYRRIAGWQITGAPSIANIFTLSMGYQF